MRTIRHESPFALYKGASPPALGWCVTDAVLLGSLHNYRLWLLRHGWAESGEGANGRLGVGGQALAGFGAGMSK